MARPPAFMFYAADFRTNTAELTHEERGVYIDLLCHAWINDGLPSDETRLYRLIGGDDPAGLWAAIAHLWEPTDAQHPFSGRWINRRMEEERNKQAARRRQKSAAGQKSAEKRKQREKTQLNSTDVGTDVATPVGTDVAPPLQRNCNFSIESEIETETAFKSKALSSRDGDSVFTEIWTAHPVQRKYDAARAEFYRRVEPHEFEQVAEQHRIHAATWDDPAFTPDLHNWLKSWRDEPRKRPKAKPTKPTAEDFSQYDAGIIQT